MPDDQILIGTRLWTTEDGFSGDPYYCLREKLKQTGIHFLGGPGSGKSSSIATLLSELGRVYITPEERQGRDCIAVIDLGGDTALFQTMRELAKATGRRFFQFHPDAARSFELDPFSCLTDRNNAAIKVSNMLQAGFNLGGGMDGGERFWADGALYAIHRLSQMIIERRKRGENVGLDEIHRDLERRNKREEQSVKMTVRFMLDYPQLHPRPGSRRVVDLAAALERGDLLYFFIPTLGEQQTMRVFGSIAMQMLLFAATERCDISNHLWFVIDEFQEIVGRAMAEVIPQWRKFGITPLFANQAKSQLRTHYVDLEKLVNTCTNLKFYYSFESEQDIKDVLNYSKDDISSLGSQSISFGKLTETNREFIDRKLKRDKVLEVNAKQNTCLVIDHTQGEHVEPTALKTHFAIAEETFRNFKRRDIPRVEIAARQKVESPISSDKSQRSRSLHEAEDEEILQQLWNSVQ